MLWHETAGSCGTAWTDGTWTDGTYTRGKYDVPIYTTIRRMVIVKVFHGYSWCM